MRLKNIEETERFKRARTRAANMGCELGETVNGYSVRKTWPGDPSVPTPPPELQDAALETAEEWLKR